MKRNLFEGLLNDENHYSDALCNLCSLDSVAIKLSELINIEGLNRIESDCLSTRTNSEGNGFPDIVFNNKKYVIAFEVKTRITTTLTHNQPEGYLEYLSSFNKNKYIVLLIPVGYKHEDDFIKRYNKWVEKKNVQIKLIKLYWQDLIFNLATSFKDDLIVQQFCKQVSFDYSRENIMFNDEEMKLLQSKTALLFLKKIDGVIQNVLTELKKEKINFQKTESSDGENTYYILDDKNAILFWFGRWDELWESTGYALVVGCHEKHKNYAKFSTCKTMGPYCYDPITEENDKSNISNEFLLKIKKYV